MAEKVTTIRTLIAIALIGLGLLICACAVGTLDYADAAGITTGIGDIWAAIGKGAVGIVLTGVGAFIVRNMEFEDESEETSTQKNSREG